MNKDLSQIINNLNKKIKDLYKYKNFVDLNRNSKKLYEKFMKMQTDNLRLVSYVKYEKNNFDLLQRENVELKKVLNKLKNDGLSYENKKKFYQTNLKNNELTEKNNELKDIIKNKENKIIELNGQMSQFKDENENIKIILNHFYSNISVFLTKNNKNEEITVLEDKIEEITVLEDKIEEILDENTEEIEEIEESEEESHGELDVNFLNN
tara:strand:- start:294 stop:920 length:627 start_codon:yes stop_codon:yes gene_type:complete